MRKTYLRIMRLLFIAPFVFGFLYAMYNGIFSHITFMFHDMYGVDAFVFTLILLGTGLWWLWLVCILGIILTSIGLYQIKKNEKV